MKRDWIQTGRRPSGICGEAGEEAALQRAFEKKFATEHMVAGKGGGAVGIILEGEGNSSLERAARVGEDRTNDELREEDDGGLMRENEDGAGS
eukprot:2918311-Pleurochrysis_carterae.AAC.1